MKSEEAWSWIGSSSKVQGKFGEQAWSWVRVCQCAGHTQLFQQIVLA